MSRLTSSSYRSIKRFAYIFINFLFFLHRPYGTNISFSPLPSFFLFLFSNVHGVTSNFLEPLENPLEFLTRYPMDNTNSGNGVPAYSFFRGIPHRPINAPALIARERARSTLVGRVGAGLRRVHKPGASRRQGGGALAARTR